jgi:hypothetical protein
MRVRQVALATCLVVLAIASVFVSAASATTPDPISATDATTAPPGEFDQRPSERSCGYRDADAVPIALDQRAPENRATA